jgi:thymidine phosphorylase
MNESTFHHLKIIDLGIDSYHENILFIRADSEVCKSEGYVALTRLVVHKNGTQIIATLNVVHSDLLKDGEAGLSTEAMIRLKIKNGDSVTISHLPPIESLGYVRAKIFKKELDEIAFQKIIKDIVAGHYSTIEIAAFVTACAGNNLTVNEITSLTKAMIQAGNTMQWKNQMVFDKHCVGGLPGNRTTPIVVSIIAAAGLLIPKTSSRAITSPAGTADTMETMTKVNFSMDEIQRIVEKENGCFTWGGMANLSPADDLLISVEKSLDVDSEGQMVASVLSKKAAAGSTHLVIDIPVGPSAKVRSQEEALRLQYYFKAVGEALGFHMEVVITDGKQPIGRGIGPSLEAIDVLAVLRNQPQAPLDLKERALSLASVLLRLSGKFAPGAESLVAKNLLENGTAYQKFISICEAQGGFKEPPIAPFRYDMLSTTSGTVYAIDNRKLARIAKLAGAPRSPSAGVLFLAPLEKIVKPGDLLLSVYAESTGELEYAKAYLSSISDFICIKS